MLDGKFTLESDFVDSFVNYFLVNSLNKEIKNEALSFAECVNLYKDTTKVADCSSKRDLINKFFENNEEARNAKEKLKASCSEEIKKTHLSFYHLFKDAEINNFLLLKKNYRDNFDQLNNCYSH